MKTFLIFILVMLSVQVFSQRGKVVECENFYNLIAENENALVIDIRVKEAYTKKRIQDALWAGNKETFKTILIKLNKNTPLLLYCDIGKRSKQCSIWLKSMGYLSVYELRGGIVEWEKNGYPVDSTLIKDKD